MLSALGWDPSKTISLASATGKRVPSMQFEKYVSKKARL